MWGVRDEIEKLKDTKLRSKALRKKVLERGGSTGRKVDNFFSSSNPLAFVFVWDERSERRRRCWMRLQLISPKFHLLEGRPPPVKNVIHGERENLLLCQDI
ncbi:hypothetical protein GQ457_13G026860 [Hibiscus cannabinus]